MQNMRFIGIIVACSVLVGVSVKAMDHKPRRQNMSCLQLCTAFLTTYLFTTQPAEAAAAHSYWNINGACGPATVRFHNVPLPSGTSLEEANSILNDACCDALSMKACNNPLAVWKGDGICNQPGHFDCGPDAQALRDVIARANQQHLVQKAEPQMVAKAVRCKAKLQAA